MVRQLATSLILTGFLFLSQPYRAQAGWVEGTDAADSPYDVINAVNALRASYGLPPYTINSTLMAVAQNHADYMAATGKVSHTGFGGSSVTDRLLAAGYPLAGDLSLGGFASENITSGSEDKTAQEVVNGWTSDAPHLTTMISPSLTEIGAGVSVHGGRVYYVIDCALPTDNGVAQPAVGTLVANSGLAPAPAGGVIFPVDLVTPNADGDVIHEVKAGQSLWQIAIAYDTTIDEIKRLNNLSDTNIYPGNSLLIRMNAAASATSPVHTVVADVLSSPTSLPAMTATSAVPTGTATPVRIPVTASPSSMTAAVIGIIVLALLGGGIFVRLGASKKIDS